MFLFVLFLITSYTSDFLVAGKIIELYYYQEVHFLENRIWERRHELELGNDLNKIEAQRVSDSGICSAAIRSAKLGLYKQLPA